MKSFVTSIDLYSILPIRFHMFLPYNTYIVHPDWCLISTNAGQKTAEENKVSNYGIRCSPSFLRDRHRSFQTVRR